MRNLSFTLVFILLSFTSLKAQILNIEKYRLSSDTFNVFVGNIELGYSAKKQVNSIQTFHTSLKAGYLSKTHSYSLIGKLNTQTIDKTEVLSEGYLHYRNIFWRKKILSFEQFNQLQYDAGRQLTERWVFGGSGRFRIAEKDKFDFAMNVGLMYENEFWTSEDEILQNESVKSTLHFTWKHQLTKSLYLYSITFYQAKLTSIFKPRLITDTSLKLNLNSKLSFQTSYIATVDSAPIVDVAQYIYSVENKLVYTF